MDATTWNDAARAWVEAQELLDRTLRPIEDVLVDAAREHAYGGHVLDVGCGTGATTLALARTAGVATGIDVAEPMVTAARARAAGSGLAVDFVCADAAAHRFAPASFDLIASRFGVMFFADPVAAFTNLRTAARAGGRLCAITWRAPEENPFMTAASTAARPLLPRLELPVPDAPGQFGLADPDRIRTILTTSSWSEVEVRPLDVACAFPAAELDGYLLRMGPVGRALTGVDDERLRADVLTAARDAMAPFVDGDTVRFTAACWELRGAAA